MGTTAEKLTYLNETKSKIKDNINLTGAGLTNQTPFRQYAIDLKTALLNILNNGIDTLYNNFPKTTGTGTNITLNNTLQAPIKSVINGDTQQDGEPTPSNPVEIQSVTGLQKVKVQGKNLFNSNLKQGGRLFSNGTYFNATNYVHNENPISVIVGETYTLSASNYTPGTEAGFVFFNNGTFVSSSKQASPTFTVPSGVNEVYCDFYKGSTITPTDITNIQLEQGSTASEYQEYQTPQEYEINLGKNLFDKNNIISGKRLDNSGRLYTDDVYFTSDYIEVSSNTIYTLSNIESSVTKRICEYDSSKTFISAFSEVNNITTGVNTRYIRFAGLLTELDMTQLEENTQATSYSPYFTPIHLYENDQIIGTPYNWSIKRQIGSIVLNGTETWGTINAYNRDYFYVDISDILVSNDNYNPPLILSNYYKSYTSGDLVVNDISNYGICRRTNYSQILFRNIDTNSLADFKTWLSTHNTKVVYQLANPITEPITNAELINQLNAFYNAKSYNVQTNISVQGDLPMILDVSAIIDE